MSNTGRDGGVGDDPREGTEALLEELLPPSDGVEQAVGGWRYTEVSDPEPSPDGSQLRSSTEQSFWNRRIKLGSIAIALLAILVMLGIGWFGYWLGNRDGDREVAASTSGAEAATAEDEGGIDGASDNATSADGVEDGEAAPDSGDGAGGGDEGVGAQTATGPDASVASLTATLERGRFSVAGSMPNPEVVARIRTTAAIVYGRDLTDELIIDSSLPEPSWGAVAADVVAALPIISNGSVELTDDSVTIRGTAGSAVKQQQFAGAVQMILGPGIELRDEIDIVEMESPSLVIRKTGADRIELSGVVPSVELGDQIQQVVTGAYAGHRIAADITVDDGVEETFALYSLPTFAALFVEFPAWEVRYVDEMLTSSSSGAASFGVNSAEIPETGRAILDSFAAGMGGIPGLTLTIQGHTDSAGDAAYNLELSERRAQAVVDYLVATHGIADSRLIAVGFGEEQPIADNSTAEGRTKNRRVDFIIGAAG